MAGPPRPRRGKLSGIWDGWRLRPHALIKWHLPGPSGGDGQFTLSFQELSIPVSGIPIQILRNYDSRETARKGDLGYGWTLDASGIRVSESGKMAFNT